MIRYQISYSIKQHLSEEQVNKIDLVLKIASNVLNLKAKVNYFDLMLVADTKIRMLNRIYRNKDKVTDVISLAYNPPFEIINKEFNHLGEVYLDFNQCKKQAKKYGHSIDRELCFLVLHGLLHLIGYDHIEKVDEEIMFALQENILTKAKITR